MVVARSCKRNHAAYFSVVTSGQFTDEAQTFADGKRGLNAGNQFYGCVLYPSCRGTKTA